MLDAQLPQLLDIAEQLAIDVVFVVFRHAVSLLAGHPQPRQQRLDSFG